MSLWALGDALNVPPALRLLGLRGWAGGRWEEDRWGEGAWDPSHELPEEKNSGARKRHSPPPLTTPGGEQLPIQPRGYLKGWMESAAFQRFDAVMRK